MPKPKDRDKAKADYLKTLEEDPLQHVDILAASVGVSHVTIWKWCQDDPAFAEKVAYLRNGPRRERLRALAERCMVTQLKEGTASTGLIIFALINATRDTGDYEHAQRLTVSTDQDDIDRSLAAIEEDKRAENTKKK